MVDRYHASNSALRYLDLDTFHRLVPEYARVLTAIDLATLMLVRPYFMSFQHFLTIRIPTSLQLFVSATSDDIALRVGVPDVFSSYMASIIDHLNPLLNTFDASLQMSKHATFPPWLQTLKRSSFQTVCRTNKLGPCAASP